MSADRRDLVANRVPKVGRYANAFRVGFNAFEVVIEFGERFSESEAESTHTRIVTNPVFARALLDSLSDALDKRASAIADELPEA
jgi:hypothetical protein